MSLHARVPPDSAPMAAAHRALMGIAATRLRDDGEPRESAIARALARAARGRFDAQERRWLERIAERRREIPASDPDGLGAACPAWSIPRVWGRFLFALVRELSPGSCVELGCGFGMSGCYQAAAIELNGHGRLAVLDREADLVAFARESFDRLGLAERTAMTIGPIGETLPAAAAAAAPIDYAYIDAEHTEAATVENFERILPHLAPDAVVVVDDIRVDAGMRRAWDRIRANPRTSLALDLRRVGIVVAGAD